MTIRDIAVAFGIEVDQKSVGAAENAIKGVKNMASKLLGAIGIGFSIAGIANLAEAAADAEALKSQFSQVFGDLEQDASDKLDKIADETGVTVNRMKGSFTQIAAFAKTTGMEQADALDIADRSMKAVADSAAFYDRSIEDVTNSLQSFFGSIRCVRQRCFILPLKMITHVCRSDCFRCSVQRRQAICISQRNVKRSMADWKNR